MNSCSQKLRSFVAPLSAAGYGRCYTAQGEDGKELTENVYLQQ